MKYSETHINTSLAATKASKTATAIYSDHCCNVQQRYNARLFDAQLPIQISCIPVHVKDSQNPSNVSVFHHTHFISIKIDNLIFRNVIFPPKE